MILDINIRVEASKFLPQWAFESQRQLLHLLWEPWRNGAQPRLAQHLILSPTNKEESTQGTWIMKHQFLQCHVVRGVRALLTSLYTLVYT